MAVVEHFHIRAKGYAVILETAALVSPVLVTLPRPTVIRMKVHCLSHNAYVLVFQVAPYWEPCISLLRIFAREVHPFDDLPRRR